MTEQRTYKLPAWDGEWPWAVIEYGFAMLPTFMLVVRLPQQRAGVALLQSLKPWSLGVDRRDAWPGTVLFGGQKADVHTFRCTSGSASVLGEIPGGLWALRSPEYPEDLCILRSDGSPWLTSITHEKDVFLTLSNTEHDALASALRLDRLEVEEV